MNKRSELRKTRRELKFNVAPIIVADKDEIVNDKKYVSLPNLKQAIEDNKTTVLNDEEYNILLSCIDGTSRLTTKKERKTSFNEESKLKADILNRIQNKEAAFDLEQKKVALVTIDGPQRIRGLAGSGKTIILTMKAALYHMAHPNEEILYTYYTKSLFGLIKNLIERFYRDFADNREPDWKKIHILHGWGGLELGGVYSTACTDNGIEPITYNIARLHSPNPFDYVCHSILETGKITPKYDLTLIDEGQDFPDHFYQLCYALSKEKRIVWAYDDFQNIFDIKLQDEKDTFGKDKDGNYLVDFSKNAHPLQDIVLHTCYRNPRIALIAAFSLGLGIYNTKVLQRLEDNNHWELLGFKVESGESKVGDKMIISRPIEHTPNIINQELGIYTIKVQAFSDYASECRYVAQCITNDIQDQKLRPDDICVICLDNRNIKSYYSLLSKMLIKNGISTFNLVEAPNANKHFFYDNYVTLSTINKAKGNEAGMVYIIGADTIFINRDNVLLRNKLFTAITRTKGWVTITGGEKIKYCLEELNKLEKNDFKLIFTQPSKETTKTIENGSRNQQNLLFDVQAKIDLLVNSGLSVDDIMQFIQRKKMNEAVFKISINEAGKILKKMDFLKSKKDINIGKYSQESLDAVKSGDLKTIYQTAVDNNDYELLLDDDSIFQFSKNGDKLRYAFIQSQSTYFSFQDFLLEMFDESDIPTDEQLLEEMEVEYAEDYEQRRAEQKINLGAMYIRYDVDHNGYRPNLHSYAHIHIGLNNNFRLPSSIILTPLSFVLFVMKHVYITHWEIAIKQNIIDDQTLQFKRLCENIPNELWQISEQRELYII